jgi:multidrug efflux pump subunit AcrB
MPSGLVPQEDQGVIMAVYQLPPVSSLPRTEAVRETLAGQLLEMEEIQDLTIMAGFDIFAGSLRTNAGIGFINLSDWRDRKGPGQDAMSIAGRIMGVGMGIPDANIFSFSLPPIQGLSLTGGMEGYLMVTGNVTQGEIEDNGPENDGRGKSAP